MAASSSIRLRSTSSWVSALASSSGLGAPRVASGRPREAGFAEDVAAGRGQRLGRARRLEADGADVLGGGRRRGGRHPDQRHYVLFASIDQRPVHSNLHYGLYSRQDRLN